MTEETRCDCSFCRGKGYAPLKVTRQVAPIPKYHSFQEWYAFFGGEEMAVSRDDAAKIWTACESLYKRKPCRWTYDEDDCFYSTECGKEWYFPDGTALDNGVEFCMHCGGKVIINDRKKEMPCD